MENKTKLTESPTQLAVLLSFCTYFEANEIAPSYEDTAADVGCSKATARQATLRLVGRGLLAKTKVRYRGFKPTEAGKLFAREFTSLDAGAKKIDEMSVPKKTKRRAA